VPDAPPPKVLVTPHWRAEGAKQLMAAEPEPAHSLFAPTPERRGCHYHRGGAQALTVRQTLPTMMASMNQAAIRD